MIRIVDTRPEHLDDILLMEQQCFSVPWTRDQLAAQMSDSMYIFLAAEDESGRAVGYVGLMSVSYTHLTLPIGWKKCVLRIEDETLAVIDELREENM